MDLGQVVIDVFIHEFQSLFSVQHPGYGMLKDEPAVMLRGNAFKKLFQVISGFIPISYYFFSGKSFGCVFNNYSRRLVPEWNALRNFKNTRYNHLLKPGVRKSFDA